LSSRQGVVVLDDYFPTKGTGFRIAEFDWLLRRGVVSEVMTTVEPLDRMLMEYAVDHPRTYRQISPFDADRLQEFELASLMFLNNAAYYLPSLERAALPFVLTLYPGGGLYLDNPEAKAKLDSVLGSPQLAHVITTQPVVTDLVKSYVGGRVPVTEVLGGVMSELYMTPGPGLRTNYFGSGKTTLDICFVAARYTPSGVDKGFPVFLESLLRLQEAGVPFRGHLVGGFAAADVPEEYSALKDLTFSGVKTTRELREFFLDMDVIVSPNAPGHIAPGSFDGFPTGACVEAALCGVAVVCSDPLDLNRTFTDRRDIHLPTPDAADVSQRILSMAAEPEGVRRVAQAGLRTARRAFGVEAQLWPRRRVIEATRRVHGGVSTS
jgi:glycosyltransferase involved in cell wall biosynthesis